MSLLREKVLPGITHRNGDLFTEFARFPYYRLQNWRGRPLVSRAVVVNLIGNTTTRTGLEIQAVLDTNSYETGIKVTDEELAAVRITRDEFHGEWNYTISPRR